MKTRYIIASLRDGRLHRFRLRGLMREYTTARAAQARIDRYKEEFPSQAHSPYVVVILDHDGSLLPMKQEIQQPNP